MSVPNGHYVYIVNNRNVAEMHSVTILYDDGTEAAVKGKVRAGDKVITAGQLRAEPGRPVAISEGAPRDGEDGARP